MWDGHRTRASHEIIEITNQHRIRLKNNINDSTHIVTLGMLRADQVNILDQYDCVNQLFIVYKNGVSEVLPRGLFGNKIKDYLGLNFTRIKYWTVLPMPPRKLKDKVYKYKDVYTS